MNGPIRQREVRGGVVSFYVPTTLKGDFYTIDAKAGYLFTPLPCVPWNVYPLVTYTYDSINLKFNNFPEPFVVPVTIKSFSLKNSLYFSGPAIGLGTVFAFSKGFTASVEGSWQFRKSTLTSTDFFELLVVDVLDFKEKVRSSVDAWLYGPRINLGLEYSYCNWFFGTSGEWQYLRQFTSSKGTQTSTVTATDLTDNASLTFALDPFTGTIVKLDPLVTPLRVEKVSWNAWIWRAYIGYVF